MLKFFVSIDISCVTLLRY